ncbi:MAG TPA: pitrilysin family protein [Longimicrobiales bacterium]|nr:pitrilysin family protein [Longimicrobiales bacterium]
MNHKLLSLALVLGSTSIATAQSIPKLQFEKYTLPNGLEVILHEDHSVPLVTVNTWFHVGSGDEDPGRTGFAHLFEHIMFMGSQHVPVGMFDVWLESAGANNNGSTTEDRTNYYEDMPANALPLALWLDADRMGWLIPTMDISKVDLQRDVVKNERRQSYDNQPYGRAYETILAALFPPTHPYSWPVIGSMKDLSAAQLEDVKNFFRRYYAPNNATISIGGDFNPAEVKQLIDKYFGNIPRGPAITRKTSVPAPQITKDVFLVMEDQVQLPRMYYTYQSTKLFGADDANLEIMARILGGDNTSRLYKRLVYELQVAQDVAAFQNGMRLDGIFQIRVTPKPGHTPAEMAKLVDEEVAKIVNSGVTERELQRAKNSIAAGFLDRLSAVGGFSGKSDLLNYYNYFVGTPDYVQQDLARYTNATSSDIQRVAREQFAKPKVVLTVVPEGQTNLKVMP